MSLNDESPTGDEIDAIAAQVLSAPAYLVFQILRQRDESCGGALWTPELAVITGLSEADVETAINELSEKGIADGAPTCDICGFRGVDDDQLDQHVFYHHPEQMSFRCTFCGAELPALDAVDHIRDTHPIEFKRIEPSVN